MTALDLLTKPEIIKPRKEYFAEQTKTMKWQSLIPAGRKPPIYLNKEKMERFRPELDKLRYDPAKYKTYLEQLGIEYPTVRNSQLRSLKRGPEFRSSGHAGSAGSGTSCSVGSMRV